MMHYQSDFGSEFLLKTYTDSDWASNEGTCKSVSACCLMMNSCLLNSGSRKQGLIALSSAEAETYAATSGACDALFLSRCLGYLLEAEISIKLLIDNSACRYILSRAGCGRVRHLSTRVLWMQQRVERKELCVGAVPSAENVSDIGAKRLSVPTMKYLTHNLGVYDSETSTLVGQDEYDMRVTKHNLKLITTSSNFKASANLIRLIVASSLAPTDALSCGTLISAMDMAWIDWSSLDSVAVNFLKFPFMQLYYLIEYMAVNFSKFSNMQLFYILEYAQAWMDGFVYLTGCLFTIVFSVCLICRIVFGPDAIPSSHGRMFVLFGELLECMAHHFLEWYGERRTKYWHEQRERCFASKDKPGNRYAQQRAIYWREYLRVLQGIVCNMFDDMVVESPRDRYVRYQCSSMCECSSPTYWQKVHHGENLDLSDEDFLADYISSRQVILQPAREARDTAEMEGDAERMYHYENIIETITPL